MKRNYQQLIIEKAQLVRGISRLISFLIAVFMLYMSMWTLSIGLQRLMFSNDVYEAERQAQLSPYGRLSANAVYKEVQEEREKLYSSEKSYTRWISRLDSFKAFLIFLGWTLYPLAFLAEYVSTKILIAAKRAKRAEMSARNVRS